MSNTDIKDGNALRNAKAEAVVTWVPTAVKELSVVAYPVGLTGSFTLWWGDGTSSEGAGGAGTLSHTYPAAGAYRAVVRQGDAIVAQGQVFVRAGLAPSISFAPASDNPNIIEATVNDEPANLVSEYAVTWEPGKEPQRLFAPKGAKFSHGFPAGEHPITVLDVHTGRALTETVTVTDPTYDPDFSTAKGANEKTVECTITKLATVKEIIFDWGDGAQTRIATPAVGMKQSHPYDNNDSKTYIIQLVYADGTTDGSARVVTIPFPAAR